MNEGAREKMEVDVLFVGAGPAALASAYQLAKRAKEEGQTIEIAILEKCREVGDSILSGAVMDPHGMNELMPDWLTRGAPVESKVTEDYAYFLTKNKALRFPITPPPLRQHGNYILSLSKFTRWMSQIVSEMGVNIFTGFTGREILMEEGRVIGVRTGDKGIDKHGQRKGNFEAGIDIHAKITILSEGVRGSLTRDVITKLGLDKDRNPPSFGTGVKEVWEIKEDRFPKGLVYHTMGFPANRGAMGGGWLYGMDKNLLSLGYVTWLSYSDPETNPHLNFQTYKTHPLIKKILEGGKMVQYGAKAVSVGGWYSIPKLIHHGLMLIGESGNLVDGQRLKVVHLAIASGMRAANTAFEALKKKDFSESTLKAYPENIENSWITKELLLSRNFHQAFENGFTLGLIRTGIQTLLGGRDILGDRLKSVADVRHMKKLEEFGPTLISPLKFDNQFLFDKLTDVYNSGAIHEEDQPAHLLVPSLNICQDRCTKEYGNPCTKFCPAQVYEMEEINGARSLKLNPSNCVHCKTCDIMDPYNNIRWVTPEGGGGPQYTIL